MTNKPWETEPIPHPAINPKGYIDLLIDGEYWHKAQLAAARALYEAMEKEARIEGGGGTFKYWFSGFENQLWLDGRKADGE
jgi:hypothetical protein